MMRTDNTTSAGQEKKSLGVVIPAYKAAETITGVIQTMPACVDHIIVVNDASPDNLDVVVKGIAAKDSRVIYLEHTKNTGVGGAMITGFKKAKDLKLNYIAKIDADGQMDPEQLSSFLYVAEHYECDYVKANRFGRLHSIENMPKIRLFGNIALSFLTKFSSGYWNVFDPQNGYVMISADTLDQIPLDHIDRSYFFENSMLIHLNILNARIGEIYIPAIYANETSSLAISKTLFTFPRKLLAGLCYRMYQKYILRSLSPVALLSAIGISMLTFGGIWSALAWNASIQSGTPATSGTVIIGLMPILMGWTALLQALVIDMQAAGECILFNNHSIPKKDNAL